MTNWFNPPNKRLNIKKKNYVIHYTNNKMKNHTVTKIGEKKHFSKYNIHSQ